MAYDFNRNNTQRSVARKPASQAPDNAASGFDFGSQADAPALQMNTSLMTPEVAREVATVQAQVVMAKAYPRNLADAIKRIQGECSRRTLAEKASYVFKRGTSEVSGPSIRLAESIARCYGNIKYGFEVQSSSESESKVRSYCYDLETNVSAERIFMVNHIMDTKNGPKVLTDQRDIYEHVANQSTRRERACILEVIPGDIVDFALAECQKTLTSSVVVDSNSILGIINAFRSFGVSKTQLEAYLDRNIESISAEQLLKLRQIWTGFKDGMSKPEDIFLSEEDARKERDGMGQPMAPSPAIDRKTAPESLGDAGLMEEDQPVSGGPEDFVGEELEEL